eukprot:11606913-Ditylum_brightwellii.AAC.1
MHVLKAPRYKGSDLGETAILADARMKDDITTEQIVNAMTFGKKLKMATERHAIETVLLIQQSLKANPN